MSNGDNPQYFRFGPRDRSGLIAGIRTGQLVVMTTALVLAVVLLRSLREAVSGPLAFLVVAFAAAVTFWPIGGRTVEEWIPTALRYGSFAVARGRSAAVQVSRDAQARRPPSVFGSFELLEILTSQGRVLGALRDKTNGTWTAVLSIGGDAFALLGEGERLRRVDGWSSVLAAISRDSSALYRLQWIERTLPDRGERYKNYFTRFALNGIDGPSRAMSNAQASYEEFLSHEADGLLRHELLLAVSVRGPKGRLRDTNVPSSSRPQRFTEEVLVREVATLDQRCRDAGIAIDGVLSRDGLAGLLRHSVEVAPRAGPVTWPWPIAVDTSWSTFCTDGTWHATYWIAEWPRSDVGTGFLIPLLVGAQERRAVSVVMAPVPPVKAVRAAERARTSGVADDELRRRHGFALTARTRREHDAAARREGELAEGHAAYRFSGYVTVTSTGRGELDQACARIEQAAALARLELCRLYGTQAEAFCCTLPTGRGCV
jgi:hypothetical protein